MPSKDEELLRLIHEIDNSESLNIKDFFKLIKNEEEKRDKKEKNYDENYIEMLKDRCELFLRKDNFKKGDLVKWKSGLKNRKLPHENQPAIIVDILEKPVYGNYDAGSPYFQEPLDIVLGLIDEDNEFIVFYYDKRRFERYEK